MVKLAFHLLCRDSCEIDIPRELPLLVLESYSSTKVLEKTSRGPKVTIFMILMRAHEAEL